MVIVHRVNTFVPLRSVGAAERGKVVQMILDTRSP